VAFGNEVGLSQIANLYNDSIQRHHGKLMAVYNCKQPSDGRWVQDYERGVNGGISPYPWQTDTSIGDWFYNRHWKYQPVSWTVHMLVDITSKNGNLLLNVVLRPDGSLDPEVETMLHQLADWTAVNGEAIFGTRPWLVYGEGGVKAKGGAFKENFQYTAKDIRFTTKGKTLFAIAMGWPDDGKVVIQSLAKTEDANVNKIKRVELLGYKGKLAFTQTADGLTVELPDKKLSDLTCSLRINGSDLKPIMASSSVSVSRPDAKGNLTLSATDAELHGSQLKLEEKGGKPNIGYWDKGEEWVSWTAQISKVGAFKVSATIATTNPNAGFVVQVGAENISAEAPVTGGWGDFQTIELGQIQIKQPGSLMVIVRAKDPASWKAINLNSVQLTPVD
jgi:alpha-L-fucosidase